MNIDLTDREIELLMAALGARIGTLEQHPDAGNPQIGELITELFELETDLREAVNRQDDGWGDPDDPDLLKDPVDFAAKHDTSPIQIVICDAEINAETATSRAAGRRALNFRFPNVATPDDDDRSEVQKHDVFDCEWNPDDPKNW